MQLLSLSINGFKSFAKPTVLQFAPGVTAVVGPNGCGKSNIVDSLRWVLGEQRSAILRSDRMDNVIFNGTAIRKPAGMSEVKIALDNSKGLLATPFAEVEIARRLFRDGTSEYLLNGNLCRLRDVTDLLHDSGMSPNQYTILELKMVEDILREDGEGRRALFEEAAGVAKYKIRRRQAQQKLKQTEEDLVRLADILTEVERQVSSLKRQAMRARKYQEYSSQLRVMETVLLWREYQRLLAELRPLDQALAKSSVQTDAVKGAIRLEEAQLLEFRRAEVVVETEAGDSRKRLSDIVAEISSLEAEEAALRARDQSARQTIERARRERQLLADKQALLESRLNETSVLVAGIREELQAVESRVVETSEYHRGAEEALSAAEQNSKRHGERLSELRHQASERRDAAAKTAMVKAGLASRKDLLLHEIEQLANEEQTFLEDLQHLQRQIADLDIADADSRTEDNRLREALKAEEEELARLDDQSRSLSGLIEATRARLALLSTLEEKGPRSHSALRALRSNPVDGAIGLLGDAIDVDDSHRGALQAALGPAAYYYLVETTDSAIQAIEMLRREQAGRTTLLVISELSDDSANDVLTPPEGTMGTALSLIRSDVKHVVLRRFLGRVVLVKDWTSALQHCQWARDNGCLLVTTDGQWIDSSGMMRGGSDEPEVPVDLGLGKQVAELKQRFSEAEIDREDTTSRMRAIRSKLAGLQQARDAVRHRLDELTSRRISLREQELRRETQLTTLTDRRRASLETISEIDRQVIELDEQLHGLNRSVEDADRRLQVAELEGGGLIEKLAQERQNVIAKRELLHKAERDRDSVTHKLELAQNDANRIEQSLEEIAHDLESAQSHAEQAANDLIGIESRLKEIDGLSIEKYKLRDERAGAVDKYAVRLDEIRNQIAEQDNRLHNLRDSHAGELEGSRRIETDVARLRGELDAMVSNARTQNGLDLNADDFESIHGEALNSDATAEQFLELKQKIERLGPVNPLAVEEYEQENARLDLMLAQREDLLKAKATLEDTIARINETAQAKFLHTFEAVRAHFQRLFGEFFVAGEADLILTGADLLEADITMWANPSGKRLKSLSLMSGGEKTMTAIALLFALYQVKPSPFCVFDEVDAPLDDANIDRFTRMLRIHSENTQFIVVTHNRRTMEIADNLYGVTMEEEGISKLVSVRLLSPVS